jgi:hypothetical protein
MAPVAPSRSGGELPQPHAFIAGRPAVTQLRAAGNSSSVWTNSGFATTYGKRADA